MRPSEEKRRTEAYKQIKREYFERKKNLDQILNRDHTTAEYMRAVMLYQEARKVWREIRGWKA